MKFVVVMISCLSLTSCGAIFGKRTQNVTFRSIPSDAEVYVNNRYVGRTPVLVALRIYRSKKDLLRESARKQSSTGQGEFEEGEETYNRYNIRYSKVGYESIEFFIRPERVRIEGSVNRILCTMDVFASIFTLGIPMVFDSAYYSCGGFESYYSFDLDTRESNALRQDPSFASKDWFTGSGTLGNSKSMIIGGANVGK